MANDYAMEKWIFRVVLFLTALFPLSGSAQSAQQKSYPEKPITLLVGYAADAASDRTAHALAEAMKKHLSQPMVVVDRPGGSGSQAVAEALSATPDGYTLGFGTIGILTVQPHRINLPYGGPDTYMPVAKLGTNHNVLIVRAGAPWKTAQQFLDDARAHPGTLSVGVPEVATVAHLNIEQLQRVGKFRFKVMSFDAPKQAEAAVRGEVDAAVIAPAAVSSYLERHEVMVLGVFATGRWARAPDVPTFKELGFEVTLGSGGAVVAPRGTPQSIVTMLTEAIQKAVTEPSYVSFAKTVGSTIDYEGPEAFARELRQAYEENGELLRALGLTQK